MDNIVANKKKMLWSIINNASIMKKAEQFPLFIQEFQGFQMLVGHDKEKKSHDKEKTL